MAPRNNGFSFMQLVVGAMALLKAKEKYDDYRQVAEDEEGRVALVSATPEAGQEGHIALSLDTEIPGTRAIRPKKKKACCMCCGIDCSLFWKAVGIVLAGYTLYLGYKAAVWAMTDTPTGLEGMPTFGESLGCSNAPFTYNNAPVTISAPVGELYSDHVFDVRGYGVGTVTIADNDANSKDVKYEITIQANEQSLLNEVSFAYPDVEDDGTVRRSRLILQTAHLPGVNDKLCMKYDIKVFIPPTLKKLQIDSHSAATQIQFAPSARMASVDEIYLTTYARDEKNMIVSTKNVTPKKLSLEVYHGWIVGEASIVEETSISTQRGDGVANVKVYPTLPMNAANPEKASLRTSTGTGRSDFTFVGQKGAKRPIDSNHISSGNGDVYLTYREAAFDGKIQLESRSHTMTGATPWDIRKPGSITPQDGEEKSKWTHFVGNRDGEDEIYVSSRGWTGLYF